MSVLSPSDLHTPTLSPGEVLLASGGLVAADERFSYSVCLGGGTDGDRRPGDAGQFVRSVRVPFSGFLSPEMWDRHGLRRGEVREILKRFNPQELWRMPLIHRQSMEAVHIKPTFSTDTPLVWTNKTPPIELILDSVFPTAPSSDSDSDSGSGSSGTSGGRLWSPGAGMLTLPRYTATSHDLFAVLALGVPQLAPPSAATHIPTLRAPDGLPAVRLWRSIYVAAVESPRRGTLLLRRVLPLEVFEKLFGFGGTTLPAGTAVAVTPRPLIMEPTRLVSGGRIWAVLDEAFYLVAPGDDAAAGPGQGEVATDRGAGAGAGAGVGAGVGVGVGVVGGRSRVSKKAR